MGTLHEDLHAFLFLSREIFIGGKNVRNKFCREKWNTFYIQCTFPMGLTVSETIKGDELYVYISYIIYSVC
jgi:hypothetical protein